MMGDKNSQNANFIRINDLAGPELDYYRVKNEVQLKRANEPAPGVFICESAKIINRALDAGYEAISVLSAVGESSNESAQYDVHRVYSRCVGVPIYLGDDEILRNLAGYALSGGILAAMKRREMPSLTDFLSDKKYVAILDDVENPTNIGAIFRSAAALGVEGIIITSNCADPLYRRAARVSMGTVFQVPWTVVENSLDYLSSLKSLGFATVAMALSNDAISVCDSRLKNEAKLAVILGNEGYGLSTEVVEASQYVAMIPMRNNVDSLNVAAASAVMFWELRR